MQSLRSLKVLSGQHSFEDELVDKVQAKLLRIFRPRARLPAGHPVGLEQRVAGLQQKLQAGKVHCITAGNAVILAVAGRPSTPRTCIVYSEF